MSKPEDPKSFFAPDPDQTYGDKSIPSEEIMRNISRQLGVASNDSDNEMSSELSPDELPDKSGSYGPFTVVARPGSDGEDDKVVVGPNSENIEIDQPEGHENDSLVTMPKSTGRSKQTQGILHTVRGSYFFSEETVISLWNFDDHPHPDDPPYYQTATLFMDLRGWNGEQAITSDFFIWGAAPYQNEFNSVYNNVKDLITHRRDVIIPLAHVVVGKNDAYTANDLSDIPNKVYHIYSFWSGPEIDRTNVNFSAVPVKITGNEGTGAYNVDIHSNGKHEDKTGEGVLEVYNINISEPLPSGTWLSADYTSLQVTA